MMHVVVVSVHGDACCSCCGGKAYRGSFASAAAVRFCGCCRHQRSVVEARSSAVHCLLRLLHATLQPAPAPTGGRQGGAQKTVPALAQLSVSPVITTGSVPAWVGRGSRGATRSTTIQFGWRRHGPLLKWEKAAWRRQHGWRRVSSSDGAPRPPRASNSRPHPALLTHTEILTCVSHHSHSRRSLDIRRQLRLYGAWLQGR